MKPTKSMKWQGAWSIGWALSAYFSSGYNIDVAMMVLLAGGAMWLVMLIKIKQWDGGN